MKQFLLLMVVCVLCCLGSFEAQAQFIDDGPDLDNLFSPVGYVDLSSCAEWGVESTTVLEEIGGLLADAGATIADIGLAVVEEAGAQATMAGKTVANMTMVVVCITPPMGPILASNGVEIPQIK